MKKFIILLSILISSQISFSQNAIFVSPNGNDANSGIETLPLKTLSEAVSLSRKNNIKTIILRAGKYYGVSINLTPTDSGLIIKNFPNEEPILYGGIQITKFYKENKYICADLAENKAGWDFRMILVNDSLRERSRLPENGYFNHLSVWNVKNRMGVYGGWARKPTKEELTSLKFDPKDVNPWIKDSASAELTVLHSWDESFLGIRSVDMVQHILHFSYPAIQVPGSFGNKQYIVWNTMLGISHPGQWYCNKKNNKIYYLPFKGEDINNIEMTVPISRNVITFSKGTKSITLEGLIIKASGNKLQNESFASIEIDAAITGNGVSNIFLNKLTITHTGGSAIKLTGNNITLSELMINDIGGGGIYFSGKNIKINNSTIENAGLIFYGSVGINGNGISDSIINCNIYNTPYSGISIMGDSCLIEKCTIKHAMNFFQDGGAIYCGVQKNTSVRNNFVIGTNIPGGKIGIYFDEQSTHCLAENNIVINTGIPVHCHITNNILYENNLFFDANPQHIIYDGSTGLALNHNLFIAPSILFNGPSIHDAKVDTLTLDPKIRKYANPTGVSSFQNNLILITGNPNEKTIAPKLPLIDQNSLSGTFVKTVDKSETNDFKTLINSQLVKKYIDIKKLNLNDTQINEILKETRQ